MKANRNVLVWHLVTFFTQSTFVLPIWVIFNTQFLGLNNAQAFLLGVLPYGLSALFEVPTGSWADKYGRAKVFQVGTVFYLLSAVCYLVFKDYYVLLAFQVVGALGIAMQSGGLEALVRDSIPEPHKDEHYARAHGNNNAIRNVSRVITVLAGAALYAVNPRAPFVALSVAVAIGLIISFWFQDVRAETPSELSSFNHIRETFKLMRGSKLIITMIGLFVLYRFMSESLFAMYQPYFQSVGIKVSNFGVFYAIISLFSALGSLWVGRLIRRYNVFHIMPFMLAAVVLTLAGMLLRIPWLLYFAIIPSGITFGFKGTIESTSIQRIISSRHQATALSINSFISTGTFFLAVITLGVVLDRVSVATANSIYAIVGAIFIIPFIINARKGIKAKVI